MNNAKRLAAHSIKAPPDEFAHHQRKPRKHTHAEAIQSSPLSAPHLFKCDSAHQPAAKQRLQNCTSLFFFFIKTPNLAAAAD
jgi:hypothetical protein